MQWINIKYDLTHWLPDIPPDEEREESEQDRDLRIVNETLAAVVEMVKSLEQEVASLRKDLTKIKLRLLMERTTENQYHD